MLRDKKTLQSQSRFEAPRTSGKSTSGSSMSTETLSTRGFGEANLPASHLPGDVKERLQVKPEVPPRRKESFGDKWIPAKSVDRMGPVVGDDAVGAPRLHLQLNRYQYDASFDDVQAEENAAIIHDLETCGSSRHDGTLKEHFTDESNEPLYETVEDMETGKESLLYRNNI